MWVKDARSKIRGPIETYKNYFKQQNNTKNYDYINFLFEKLAVNGKAVFEPIGDRINNYDLLIKVYWIQSKPGDTTLASASPYLRHPDSQRPVTGIVWFNSWGHKHFQDFSARVRKASNTLTHEIGHIIAFNALKTLHPNYVDYNTTVNKFLWKGPKVVEHAQKFYNCKQFTAGVPLETNKGASNPGGHFSEVFLANEMMTPFTGKRSEEISKFSLALAEDTKWYMPDYSFTENFSYGYKIGCNE